MAPAGTQIDKRPECSSDQSQDAQRRPTHHPTDDQEEDEVKEPHLPTPTSSDATVNGHTTILSKRTERQRKKQLKKLAMKKTTAQDPTNGIPLPNELLLVVLFHLRPSDLFALSRTCKFLRSFILAWETPLAKDIIATRYPCLEQCIRLPVLLDTIDPAFHPALLNPNGRPTMDTRAFQHIPPPDPFLVCTCLTCTLHWIALCVVVDFAHWQTSLDAGDPIPVIPRGTLPAWNEALVRANADVVRKALASPLWYARVLEEHLRSITRSIRRHAQNKGDRRPRFDMTPQDEAAGTDAFLCRVGPATVDFPVHRDNYYILEAYLPNRSWGADEKKWLYLPDLHHVDLKWVVQYHAQKEAGTGGGN